MQLIRLMIVSDFFQLICFITSYLSISKGARIDEQNLIFFISTLSLYPLIATSFILFIIAIIKYFKKIKYLVISFFLNIHVIYIVYHYFNDIYNLGFPKLNITF